jgi:hypothetical protein
MADGLECRRGENAVALIFGARVLVWLLFRVSAKPGGPLKMAARREVCARGDPITDISAVLAYPGTRARRPDSENCQTCLAETET